VRAVPECACLQRLDLGPRIRSIPVAEWDIRCAVMIDGDNRARFEVNVGEKSYLKAMDNILDRIELTEA
jgi:hypothetical protein